MIILLHRHSQEVVKVLVNNREKSVEGDLVKVFWECAGKYPEDIIAWCDEDLKSDVNNEAFSEIFHHDLTMASYAVKTRFFTDAIGYVDQLPFINICRKIHYATWQMSADIGGIKGKTLLQFKEVFSKIKDFEMLLNYVGKLGQQNGLFCYSAPGLLKVHEELISRSFGNSQPEKKVKLNVRNNNLRSTASTEELFSFVYCHYKSIRFIHLFWCFLRYEKKLPVFPFLKALFKPKFFQTEVDLSGFAIRSNRYSEIGKNIDVIIPTMGRREYLLQVMEDLTQQTHLPKKVIVVEQNPDPESKTDLPELATEDWPFIVVHHFIHRTGACNARNLALEDVSADWVFFADDDNRMEKDLLENALDEIKRLGVDMLTFNYRQKNEELTFDKVKQWGTFGAGNSLVSGKFASEIRFDMAFEYGYAEDKDYGMQLRQAGCDIVYHSEIEILHLKAPRGGFREIVELPWKKERPKPSPTLMVFMEKHYTPEQLKGYKTELYLRYYKKQDIKNPVNYIRQMNKSWQSSEKWANTLLRRNSVNSVSESVL